MADKFDPYREALVVETATIWGEEFEDLEVVEKERIEEQLHAHPEECTELEYIRGHTGFARQITVHPEDLDRVGAA